MQASLQHPFEISTKIRYIDVQNMQNLQMAKGKIVIVSLPLQIATFS